MHIKVNFVQSFSGIPVDKTTTAEDIVDYILDHSGVQEIEQYSPFCTIMEIRTDGFGYPLAPDSKMYKFEKKDNLHFRILCFPTTTDVSTLDINFQELLHNQIHRLICTSTWFGTQKMSIITAAARCGVEFGPYDPQKHKVGFLANQLHTFVPADVMSNMKAPEIQVEIFKYWSEFSDKGCNSTHQDAVIKYIDVAKNYTQYGCATFKAALTTIKGVEFGGNILVGVSADGILLLNGDGEFIQRLHFEKCKVIYPPKMVGDILKITDNEDGLTYVLELKGINSMKHVINFISNTEVPDAMAAEEVVENDDDDI